MTFDKNRYDIDSVVCVAIAFLCIALMAAVIAFHLIDSNAVTDSSMMMLCAEALVFAAVSAIGIRFASKSKQ